MVSVDGKAGGDWGVSGEEESCSLSSRVSIISLTAGVVILPLHFSTIHSHVYIVSLVFVVLLILCHLFPFVLQGLLGLWRSSFLFFLFLSLALQFSSFHIRVGNIACVQRFGHYFIIKGFSYLSVPSLSFSTPHPSLLFLHFFLSCLLSHLSFH